MRGLGLVLLVVCLAQTVHAQQFGVIETTPLDPVAPSEPSATGDPNDPLGGDQVLGGAVLPRRGGGIELEGNVRVVEQAPAPVTNIAVERGVTADLRGLDKISGEVVDMQLAAGQSALLGRLEVTLQECRYPRDNPAGDAYAFLEIGEPERAERLFRGWMFASSPALSAMDHPRYDVWVIRCNRS